MAENTKPTYVYAHTTKTKNHRIHKAIQKKNQQANDHVRVFLFSFVVSIHTCVCVCFFLVLSLVYTHSMNIVFVNYKNIEYL